MNLRTIFRSAPALKATFFVLLAGLTLPLPLLAQITAETGEQVEADQEPADMAFYAGDELTLNVNSSDDVFAAGGDVIVETAMADHLILAGGNLALKSLNVSDVIAAGGEIDMPGGTIEDDVVAAGGEISLGSGLSIGGSAVLAGGEVRVETAIPAELRASGGSIYLNSAVGGDAWLSGETVELGPQARIDGDLHYRAKDLKIAPGAVITGSRTIMPVDDSVFEDWEGGAFVRNIAIAFLLGNLLLAVVLALALPGLMKSSAERIRARPFNTLGIGFLVAVAAPLALVALFASVVGIPLALLGLLLSLALAPLAFAATAFFVGAQGRAIIAKRGEDEPQGLLERIGWPALGAAAILLVGLVPLAGIFIWLIVLVLGLGAVVAKAAPALAKNA